MQALDRLGAERGRLRAKLFGGACWVGVYTAERPLGLRNVQAARALLEWQGLPLLAEDVGETYGRKLSFETSGGCVRVRRLGARV